ncbi:MAG: homocysteine S-methyltransferase family protein [Alphaproteobacteria bacterium]|nr:homocysteine S-methyltransferase family protein [Alphaproteobacteria bacterium]
MDEIKGGAVIVIDGATGTELQRRGAPMHSGAWCAAATQSHPEVLHEIHADYIRCGARVVTANTFATTREVLEPNGLGGRFEALNRQAVEIAVAARDTTPSDKPVLVAGSISHTRPSGGSSGHAWSPESGDIEKFEADCTEMVAIHKAAGADLILGEMLGCPDFTPCVIRAAQANDMPLWLGISTMAGADGTLRCYTNDAQPLGDVLESIVAVGGADVIGIMHSKPGVTLAALEILKQHWHGPLMAYPDSLTGDDEPVDAITFDHVIGDEAFVDYCDQWQDAGVQVLGGCCGLTVSHIAALTRQLSDVAAHA